MISTSESTSSPDRGRPATRLRTLTFGALLTAGSIVAGPVALVAAPPAAPVPVASSALKPAGISPNLATIADIAISHDATPAPDRYVAQADAAGLPTDGMGSLVHDGQGRLLVDITLDPSPGTVGSVTAALPALDAELIATAPDARMATVVVPADRLRELAAVDGVAYAVEVLAPMRLGGSAPARNSGAAHGDDLVTNAAACDTGVVSEGDAQLDADDARGTFSVDGTGVNVGIVSDSFNDLGNAAGDIAARELPGPGNPCGRTTPVDVLADVDDIAPDESGIDEGRAMAQIVHDLAPGAELSFATAVGGEIVMANHIRALAANGADVTTDDIAYLFEPIFQDGYIGAAINDVWDDYGVPHFTAAGNSNLVLGGKNVGSYETPAFRPTACPAGIPDEIDSCHNFSVGGTDNGNGITLDNGGGVAIALGWNEPQFGVTTDLDLFVVNSATGEVLEQSVLASIDLGRPNEFLNLDNFSGAPITVDIVVGRFKGTATPRFRHQFLRSNKVSSVERPDAAGDDVVGPTLFGHAAADKAISVGAVPFDDADTPEDFSTRGPNLTCWEPLDGSVAAGPISPCDETTVDLVATDGTANSFFGNFIGGTWRFFGTSAAAPHAAAVAALALEHAPCATNSELVAAMTSSAAGVPGFGADAVGAGRVDADAMLAALGPSSGDPCLDVPQSVSIEPDVASDPIDISVRDGDDGADKVTISATSNNPTLLPDSGIAVGGAGSARTVTLTPAAGQNGTAIVTFVARDPGGATATAEMRVDVSRLLTLSTPARVLDTRAVGAKTVDGLFQGTGPVVTGDTVEVQIAGRGGVDDDATAAVLNLSTVNSAGNGFLTIFDCTERPLASGINYGAGGVVNNEIVAKLSATGTICIFARTTTDLVIDAVGAASPASPYRSLLPARLLETRAGTGFATFDGVFEGTGPIEGGDTVEVQIAGRGGVDTDAAAAVLNLSTVNSAGNGFLTIFDCTERPLASGINYGAGGVVNNEIVAKLSATGTICIFARTTTDLVIDAVGEIPSDVYNALVPARLLETRAGAGFKTVDGQLAGGGPIEGGDTVEVQIAGRGGVDDDAAAAVLNLSTVNSAGNGFLTIFDCTERPLASGINYGAGGVVNNEIVAKLSATGTICIFARTTTDLVIDAVGDF